MTDCELVRARESPRSQNEASQSQGVLNAIGQTAQQISRWGRTGQRTSHGVDREARKPNQGHDDASARRMWTCASRTRPISNEASARTS